jgi:hypothetical protein
MSSHLVVRPDRVEDGGFVDAAPHRAALPPVYNQYQRVSGSDVRREQMQALLRPLFATGFLLDDWLNDNDAFGATSIVLASASSKTALALAFLLNSRGGGEVVGLTAAGNADFVRSVGYYDRSVENGSLADLPAATPSAFVDMAGGGQVLGDVHRHFGDALKQSCIVGATHWEESAPATDLPGPPPTFFFAPDHMARREADWGPDGFASRLGAAWEAFVGSVAGWLKVDERSGPDAFEGAWLEVLDGRAVPASGKILALP